MEKFKHRKLQTKIWKRKKKHLSLIHKRLLKELKDYDDIDMRITLIKKSKNIYINLFI